MKRLASPSNKIHPEINSAQAQFQNQGLSLVKTITMVVILFLAGGNAFGQEGWKLSTEKEGIKVYTLHLPNSKVNAVKVECVVNASQTQLVALLMDIKGTTEWIYHTKSCVLIKQISPSDLYYYSEISLPWPAENRDFVAHLTATQNPVTKVITVDGPAVPGMVPLRAGIVRINNSKSKWTITSIGLNRVNVVYTLHVEPGGNIPAWVSNMFATEGPLQIFKKLKIQVQKPAYKNALLQSGENKLFAVE